jgi:uroporphyrinogen-III synthase
VTSHSSRPQTLSGRGIVITRPLDQGRTLAALVEREGGRAILFPVIDILDVADRSQLESVIDRLDRFYAAVFISPNAVNKAMDAISARRTLPEGLRIAAIGPGSARELNRRGVARVIVPKARFDSEALLDLPELEDVSGKRIVIFRGDGGRPVLGDTLAERGAIVEYAECYRRGKSTADVAPLLDAWSRGEIHGVVATSSEGLRNLHEMLGDAGRGALAGTPLFVPHPRIAATARDLGLTRVVVTASGDEGIADAIHKHHS